MEIKTNGEYNPAQINETFNFSPDGRILSKSLMFNLRNETPEKVWKAYLDLRKLTDDAINNFKNRDQRKDVKNKKVQNTTKVCPRCGAPLVERSGISKKSKKPYHFWGCSNFPKCSYTEPFLDEEMLPEDQKQIMFEQDS